jgi:hypothetical protein
MASAVLPTAAYARPNDDLDSRSERASEKAERSQRAERPERAESSSRSERAVRVDRPERPVRVQPVQRAESEPRMERQRVVQTRPDREIRRDRRPDNLAEGFAEAARRQRDDRNVEVRDRDGSFTGIPTQRVERHDRDSNHRRWSDDWRRDHRYDWRNYRNSHRSLFRLGRYYDPYGWNYRRFSIGFNLGSSYYGSNYWLDDPWMYRLPPAYGPYRWVRYYDDALLVNIYTGQVVDVLYNFFW